ncbi:hypothetical protein PR202_ga08457 [Eleusine coracana subsp. coracana]|uniref:CG-1 domain-containing protein n=1 Tax=Eleusine coracana subsp. coracana TaxID=191504 RepID=A0AAV5C2A0_ELECO|nr:hypothetical protein PR202_ga08457 [Eleusine coracana subsp. coracana]
MQQQGFDIHKLELEVKTRWLRPKEILQILQNHEWFTIAQKPAHKPPSGSWFLYNRRVLRFFRNDGYTWQKKKNGKASNEAHECLKVDNKKALSCYYARGDQNPTFQRRIYWMLDPAYDHMVFVHYRDVLEGSISISGRNDSSTSNQNGSASRAEVHSSPGWTSELTVPSPNSCSPGSVEEVSSRTVTINNEANNASPSEWIQEKAALRKLKMQLSLEDKDDYDANTEDVPSNNGPIFMHGVQNGEPENCTNLNDIFNVLEFSENHTKEDGICSVPSAIDVLKSSGYYCRRLPLQSFQHVMSCSMMFGDVEVPVETVKKGVIRCHTPRLDAGKVKMYMIDVNGKPCSEEREFEFLEKPTMSVVDGNGKSCYEERDFVFHQKPTKSSDELLLLLNYVQLLFDGHGCELFSKFNLQLPNLDSGFQVNQMDIGKEAIEPLDHESSVNRVMELLLYDKFKQWLSSKVEQSSSDGGHLLPKQYHSIIHTIAALGYEWALKPLLSSGVPITTAMQMDGLLYIGLHDLAEAQLITHLDSLESKENANSKDGVSGGGTLCAMDRIWDKCTHVSGGTNDQLALKDSLGGIRNAVQAAARIQAAFRVFSFRKKQEMAQNNLETYTVSHGILEKAALSIQKNFRCWKKRREFLKMRKNIIRIQARVRAHQERNKYRELLRSVGVLEKVMLRWYRKGVGLRGFSSGVMPIDEEVEEDVVKVFRKQTVETAINKAVSRVSSIIDDPIARQQYRRMLEMYQQAKVDNKKALSCYYARGDQNPTFQRRIYWMLDSAYDHIVFVHYRDVLEGSISISGRNDSSTSNQNGSASRAEVHSSPGWTSKLTVPCPNSCSPGSVEEVSSRTVTINNEANNASPSEWIQEKAALRKLKMQLSLEDKDDYDANTEDVPSNNGPIFMHGVQNGEPENCTNLNDIFNVLEFSENHTKEDGICSVPSAIDVLKSSDTWLEEDQLEAILHSGSMTVTESQWFRIDEVSPEWGFHSESTKVIIVGDFLCNSSNTSCSMMFGDVEVPVETVKKGVIRCHTPCLDVGKVKMYMIGVNGKPCSEEREFEFLEKPTMSVVDGNGKSCYEERDFVFHQKPTKSSDELLLLLNYVQLLFDGHGCELFSKFNLQLPNLDSVFQVNQMDIGKEAIEPLDHESSVNRVMELLLNDKFKQWLSSKVEQSSSDGGHLLPKQYHSTIHKIAALGYEWALKPLLSSGVPINYRDANGWTALHWAARFGREGMVVALLAAGAAAGALSHPTSEDPAANTPASIAYACGFSGLSAFLSEAQLITHLNSLESKENVNSKDGVSGGEILCNMDRMWDKCTHVSGGTNDQLALKDSLGGIRNAVQAAARIQAAFRVFSFRKKQEMAQNNLETYTVSHGILEKAALSIQKNFRCWKKRREFLKMRKNIIRIQARVRAHQERNKYRELLRSVGVLEKVMLRWYRKGVGLRGFSSGVMPIDEEVEEDVVKVFRKQTVETAINKAVSRVSSIIDDPIARQQYRRMLEMYQQAKHDREK